MIKLFVGVPGAGKSLAMQDTVRLLNRKSKLGCIVNDRTSEWGLEDKDGNANIRWRGDPPNIQILTPNESESEIREAVRNARDNGTTCVFRYFTAWETCTWVKRFGDLVYVDDEIDLSARKKDWESNPMRDFVHMGRHLPDEEGYPREVHLLGACRRVQNIHTDLTELADEVFVFKSQGKNTLQRLVAEGWLYDENLVEVTTMPFLRFFRWTSDGSITTGTLLPLKEK